MGVLNVSVAIRGRINDFLLNTSASSGDLFDMSDGCAAAAKETSNGSSSVNKSRVILFGSLSCIALVGDVFLLTLPSSSSQTFPVSSIKLSTTGPGSGDKDEVRLGRIDGADISPTHSTLMTGISTETSYLKIPSTSKTRIFPAWVPIAMSVSEPSSGCPKPPFPSPAIKAFFPFWLLKAAVPVVTTERQVAGPATCYVLSTLLLLSKSTSRHLPSYPMLTTLDL